MEHDDNDAMANGNHIKRHMHHACHIDGEGKDDVRREKNGQVVIWGKITNFIQLSMNVNEYAIEFFSICFYPFSACHQKYFLSLLLCSTQNNCFVRQKQSKYKITHIMKPKRRDNQLRSQKRKINYNCRNGFMVKTNTHAHNNNKTIWRTTSAKKF